MKEINEMMFSTADEAILRQFLRFYIAIVSTGASVDSPTVSDLHKLQETKRYMLSSKGDKVLAKLQ